MVKICCVPHLYGAIRSTEVTFPSALPLVVIKLGGVDMGGTSLAACVQLGRSLIGLQDCYRVQNVMRAVRPIRCTYSCMPPWSNEGIS